jgi:hypothetical protein
MTKREMTQAFKKAGLTKDQVEYAHLLIRMGRNVEQAIEEAKGLSND